MRYAQLRAFHHVATEGGFSRAAEALHLTQPAVSDQVRRLEEAYDVHLFDRRKKQIVPTAQGEALLAITRRMFEAEREAAELLTEARGLREGHLRIVADSAHHLLHILGPFRARYPGVRVSLTTGNSDQVTARLQDYAAEIGVLGDLPSGSEFEVIPLGATPIVAFTAAGSALAGRDRLSFRELARLPLVMREPGSRTRAKVLEAAARKGITLEPAIEAEGREAVREIVAAGGGVGFVSRAEFVADARLTEIPLEDAPGLEMEEMLICLRQRREGKLIRAFLGLAAGEAPAPPLNPPR